MKKRQYSIIFGWLLASLLLLTTSCKDDLFASDSGGDEVTVSFTLTPEAAATVTTRGGNAEDGYVTYPGEGGFPHISDGSKANTLIYAVYDEDGDLLEEYGNDKVVNGITPGDGQTVVSIEKFPATVNITLKRNQNYKIAFWAQSSECKTYNTLDLQKVEMIYGEADKSVKEKDEEDIPAAVDEETTEKTEDTSTPNNDERRDAFCRTVEVNVGPTGSISQNVYLYRPLAQINIGTSGFDYEIINRSSLKKYTYSKIRINRAARYLNVVTDEILRTTPGSENDDNNTVDGSTEAHYVVDYGYAPLPAYVNIPVPKFPSYTQYDWKHNDQFSFTEDGETIDNSKYQAIYDGEEFLKVHLYDKNLADTKGYTHLDDAGEYMAYASFNNHEGDKSETFKYLSMCYVLTNSTKDEAITLNNIKVWLASDAEGTNERQILDLNNVPTQRNWRTNIVGNLLTEEVDLHVTLDKDFAGEYNGWYDGDAWEWSGPLADGVYFDADADEIQISNANGLLWLQRMVNGNILVRENKTGYESLTDTPFQYRDENRNKKTFNYDPIDPSKLSDDVLRRIIMATHINDLDGKLSNYGSKLGEPDRTNCKVGTKKDIDWPKNKNFNFYNATIKLMADIDLAGIEWIPIGWDLSLHDTSIAAGNEVDVRVNYLNSTYLQGLRRIFCGTFDGNGHTIKNLKTFRVGARVDDTSQQTVNRGPYDNFQWYPYGLFGMVVDFAKIKKVHLQNVDIKGYDACGALVGIVFNGDPDEYNAAPDGEMCIEDCSVDGGIVSISPMYRGDSKMTDGKTATKDRTFARGVFCGGLVGNIVVGNPKTEFHLTGCDVRNLKLRAYRQIGGLVGGIGNHENYQAYKYGSEKDKTDWASKKDSKGRTSVWDWDNQQFSLKIEGNTISNVQIICNQFQAFNYLDNTIDKDEYDTNKDIWKNGFGWLNAYRTLTWPVVGGIYVKDASDTDAQKLVDQYNKDNTCNNVTISEFATSILQDEEIGHSIRYTAINNAPLSELPMLSSWFCDKISLTANFYGEPSAYVGFEEEYPFAPKSFTAPKEEFDVPFNLPYNLAPAYDDKTPKAGLYVETVDLDGSGSLGGRSVITPEKVTANGSCVVYVTARNRKQFYNKLSSGDQEKADKADQNTAKGYKQPTIIKNMTLRGAPYAWSGLLIAPNENMSAVELNNVAIYDVHRTITLDTENASDISSVELVVKNSNLRGYTVPGEGWKNITYTNTTFEAGSTTGAETDPNEVQTYKVENVAGKTTFEKCYFKAPYVIDFEVDNLDNVVFKESYATSAKQGSNKEITLAGKTGCKYITITSSSQGEPIITYYGADGKPMLE